MFHSSNPSLFGRPDSVLSRSQVLHSIATDLRRACASLKTNSLPNSFSTAVRLLSDFSKELSGYFDEGSSAAHFDAIAIECPSLEPRARVLANGQDDLRESFTAAKKLGGSDEKICTLGFSLHIGDLLDDFDEHESEERQLLQDYFLTR